MKYLPDCLEKLFKQSFTDFKVIVIDNASKDGSPEFVEQHYPAALVIRNQINKGFCRAHNQAIRLSEAEYVMPLNPDVMMETTYLQTLLDALNKHEDAGIAVGKLYLLPERDTLDGAGLAINKARRQYLRGHLQKDEGRFDTLEYIFGADGSAPLYRREMLEDIKLEGDYFDEDFFAHKEDLDLSWRAQLSGWKCIYVPTAIAYHYRSFRPGLRGQMSSEVKLHAVKNRYLAVLKNEFLSNFILHLPWIIFYELKILGYICLFERSSLAAFSDLLRLLPSALRKRRLIMKRKRVTASYIRGLIQ